MIQNQSTPALSFGYQLRHFREARGWARKQLAYQAGCAIVTLQKIERDERKPSLDLAQRLGQALQLAPNEYAAFIAAMQAAALLPPNNVTLPQESDPILFGRAHERQLIAQWLIQQGRRLVTLTGTGGVGKTRLAEVTATTDLRPHFSDGVYIVELATIHQPAFLPNAIARAINCPVADERTVRATLLAFLAPRQLLLVLDNFEQLSGAAPLLTELLAHCPRLVLLVTSRAALHLSEESQLRIEPLALPPRSMTAMPDLATVGATPAIALFVARAQASEPTFTLTHANVDAVVELCTRLDGLPLAIELVAARVRLMSPQLLLTRLITADGAPRIGLIAQGLSTLPGAQPTRQGTLHHSLTWSYRLLTRVEQRAFSYFSLFQGGCRLVDAEVLLPNGEKDQEQAPLYIWDLLSSLLDKSLIYQRSIDGEPRFLMLETVREYAREQLEATEDVQHAQRRHAEHYQSIAQVLAERIVEGAQLDHWLAAAEREQANWRAALTWSLASGETAIVLRIATALWRFWWIRSYWQEGRDWLERGLARFTAKDSGMYRLQARALRSLGALTLAQGDHGAARQHLTTSLALARAIGDEYTEALALSSLATLWCREGAFAQAEAALLQSMAYDRKTGNTRDLAVSLGMLGEIGLYARDFAKAIRYLQQALALQLERNDHHSCMITDLNLGYAYYELGEYAAARPVLESGLQLARTLINHLAEVSGLQQLAELELALGRDQQGLRMLATAFAVAEAHALHRNQASLLRVLGEAQLRQGDELLATQLLGAVKGAQARWGVQLDQYEQAVLEERLTYLRTHSNLLRFEQAYQTGYGAPTATIAHARDWLAAQLAPPAQGQTMSNRSQ